MLLCNCKTLEPTTVINDVKGLLDDSLVGEVFGSEGIELKYFYIFFTIFN
jgi:hypothetical protein